MRPITLLILACLGAATTISLTVTPAAAGAQSSSIEARRARLLANVYLRSEPAATGKRLALVPRGEEVVVSSSQKGWTKVSARNQVGWVPTSAITGAKSAVATTPAPAPAPAPTQAATPAPQSEPQSQKGLQPTPSPVPAPAPSPARGDESENPPPSAASTELTIGARTWLVGNGTTALGVFGEKLVGPALAELANARIGISGAADYLSSGSGGAKETGFLLMGLASVHPVLPTVPRLDPFVGFGLAYGHASRSGASYGGINVSGSYNTGIVFVGQVGARYYFTEKLGVQGAIGFGRLLSGEVSLGVAWRP